MSFLLEMFTARWPPPPCLYLDCEETESEVVSLRWCLPPPDRVPIINCVLEFKDASEQWKPVQGFSFREHGNHHFLLILTNDLGIL